ncbi:LysR family transcriptional regulator [Ralstonia pickettii]|nr:LysR family transcriptional regulator [Ralstonia pickettii]
MLVAAVDKGSFSAASVELGCTQSRISHAIAELEEYVGARLLLRTRSGCTPTLAGQRVLGYARHMLSIADDIAKTTRDDGISGTVRLACLRSVATHLLPDAIGALAREYPHVHLEVLDGCHDYGSVATLVEAGRADIGITRGPIGAPFVSLPFVSDQYVVIAPTAAKLKSPVSWEQLASLPLIHIQQPGAAWILEQCRTAGLTQQPKRELANESGIVAMVERGLGYAVLPRLTVFPESPAVQVLSLPFLATRKLALFGMRQRLASKVVGTALRFIRDKRLLKGVDACRAGAFTFDY